MKFLLDENIPNTYKNILKKNGYSNIKRINDFGKGITDLEVYKISLQEERIIVTLDKDFYQYKKKENCGIISLSPRLNSPMKLLLQTIIQINNDDRFGNDFKNMFVRVTNGGFSVIYRKKSKYKKLDCKYKTIKEDSKIC